MQGVGGGKISLDLQAITQLVVQHIAYFVDDQVLAHRVGNAVDVDRFRVERNKKAAAAHIAQLFQRQLPVLHRQ